MIFRDIVLAIALIGLVGCGMTEGLGSKDYQRNHARGEQSVRF